MTFKVKYKFVEDKTAYICYLTYEQYKNFQKLPTIKECNVVKENQKDIEAYTNEMQEALDLAVKKDNSHIKKLSEMT